MLTQTLSFFKVKVPYFEHVYGRVVEGVETRGWRSTDVSVPHPIPCDVVWTRLSVCVCVCGE